MQDAPHGDVRASDFMYEEERRRVLVAAADSNTWMEKPH